MKKIFRIFFLLTLLSSCKEEKSSINLELKKELSDIWFSDQAFRNINEKTAGDTIRILAKRMKVDTVYFKKNFKSLHVLSDYENSKRIEEIINKFGYPGKALVGEPENRTTWLVIQHSDPAFIEKYLPLLRIAARNGDIDMQSLALTEDRNLMYQGKEQLYGSQFHELNGKLIMWPIQNPDKVNELRKEAGFVQTIEEYGKIVNGKEFPV